MRRALALVLLLVAVGGAAIAGCSSAAAEDAGSSEANATESWAPYASDVRADLHRLEPLTPSGVVVGDFGSAVRDQGHIAACASFSFLGLIENQMFNERGITPDLSERFMIYSNFLQTGTLGGTVDTIRRFPELTSNLGLMNEELYPYSSVEKNYVRFDADAAQGLTTDTSQVLLGDALKDTTAMSKARSEIIEKPEYVGALPAGPYPVQLPLKATLQPNAKVPQVELQGQFYDCFAADPGAKPRLGVTPKEALKMCFDIDPSKYFSCSFDAEKKLQELDSSMASSGDRCTDLKTAADLVAKGQYETYRHSLQVMLGLLEAGDAVMIGVKAPTAMIQPVWTSKLELGSGHAVVVVGYVSYEDLGKLSEQSRGILGNGMFDKLIGIVDPSYAAKIAAATDDAAKMQVRLNSGLGLRMKEEGGLLLFRNSWGTKAPGSDTPIGVDGHQAMTFDYFVRSGMVMLGRQEKRLGSMVSWAPDNACPTQVSLNLAGAWAEQPTNANVQKDWRGILVPADCGQ
jgi:outer membrane murein-binding lipoprotein Lpp